MKIKTYLLTALVASTLAVGSASANVIVSYGGTNLSLFSDTGTKILDYSTSLSNPQDVVTDNSGHVYVANFSALKVQMYDIASGAFIRDVATGYNFIGLAFNPASPNEIIVQGGGTLGRWNTTTGTMVLETPTGGGPGVYYGIYASGTQVYAAYPAGGIQGFDSTTLGYNGIGDLGGMAGAQDITGIGADLFISSNQGVVYKDSAGVATAIVSNPGGDNYYGIGNNGTNLWVAQYSTNIVAQYNTSGTNINYFTGVANPTDVAYTAIPEPSTGCCWRWG